MDQNLVTVVSLTKKGQEHTGCNVWCQNKYMLQYIPYYDESCIKKGKKLTPKWKAWSKLGKV